jgi:transcriptional regulator with XRE-family HTH domain
MSPLDKRTLTGRQIAAARTLLGMTQPELATRSSISVPTLKRMEASEGPAPGMANNVAAVRAALEDAGVEFTNGEQPGVRMKIYADPGEPAVLHIDGRKPMSCFTLQEAVLEFLRQSAEVQASATIQVRTGRRYSPDEIRRLHRLR